MEESMPNHKLENSKFLALFTLLMIAASLWIFSSYLNYILVAAVLALATSKAFSALMELMENNLRVKWLGRNRQLVSATLLTTLFLLMIFGPLLYFVSVTYGQVNNLDFEKIKQTVLEMVDKTVNFLDRIPMLQEPVYRLKSEGISLVNGPPSRLL